MSSPDWKLTYAPTPDWYNGTSLPSGVAIGVTPNPLDGYTFVPAAPALQGNADWSFAFAAPSRPEISLVEGALKQTLINTGSPDHEVVNIYYLIPMESKWRATVEFDTYYSLYEGEGFQIISVTRKHYGSNGSSLYHSKRDKVEPGETSLLFGDEAIDQFLFGERG